MSRWRVAHRTSARSNVRQTKREGLENTVENLQVQQQSLRNLP